MVWSLEEWRGVREILKMEEGEERQPSGGAWWSFGGGRSE